MRNRFLASAAFSWPMSWLCFSRSAASTCCNRCASVSCCFFSMMRRCVCFWAARTSLLRLEKKITIICIFYFFTCPCLFPLQSSSSSVSSSSLTSSCSSSPRILVLMPFALLHWRKSTKVFGRHELPVAGDEAFVDGALLQLLLRHRRRQRRKRRLIV